MDLDQHLDYLDECYKEDSMERQDELAKCCGEYPEPHTRPEDGAKRFVCKKCGNTTPYYISAGLSANKNWNEMRSRQVEVEAIEDV